MSGHLSAIGTHSPKDYPRKPADLLKKSQPQKPMSAQQWQAFASHLLGKPVRIETPSDEVT